jgi:hypothetical protein
MKIHTIEITNYKAFFGTHKINVAGKNLFIYGENGSGKSSLYYALKDFFQSSFEDIDLDQLENIFVSEGMKGKVAVKVTFSHNNQGQKRQQTYQFSSDKNDTRDVNDTSIRDGNRLKSFITYKHLLAVHYLKKEEAINLFDLLVKGVLKHFKYSLTAGRELGELWEEVEGSINRPIDRRYPTNKKKTDVNAAIKVFNEAFSEMFKPDSPEFILKHAKPILDQFNHNIDLNLSFPQVRPHKDYTSIEGDDVRVDITYAGKRVREPHLFLNEARLSAIAVSIYLGLIKRHVQGIPCKVLFLDDIFIGLDIANRLPLLEILESEFPDYQIFITTYDKPWFEYARFSLEGKAGWKTMEFYAQPVNGGMELPIIFDNQHLIPKAEWHMQQCDYKAAAVYTRSAFEQIIRRYCENKRKAVVFKSQLKKYTTEDFWKAIKDDVSSSTRTNIEKYRTLVLNTFSHYNTERHEIKTELASAITAVKDLKTELSKL